MTTPNGPSGFPRTGGSNDSLIREVAESAPAGSPVGKLITALDPENDPLTYSLTGSDTFDPPRRIFDIDPATGQIFVVGEGLDYETVQSYTVTLMVTDGKGANGAPDPAIDDTVEVVINVTDVDEPPARLGAPTVAPSSTDPNTALEVTWTAPANTGPAVTDYRVRYRKQGGGAWSEPIFTGTATAAAIGGLEPGGTYEVQVAADNDEGASPWSNSETSSTFPDTAAKIDPSGLDHRGGANEGGEADGGDSPDHNSDFSDRDGRNGPGNAYGQQVSRLDSGAYLPAYSPTESTAVFRSVVGRVSLEQQSTALLVSLRARWRVPTNRGPPVSNKGPPAG